ncbi:Platelet-activating factor acetylhydrolase IB subunit alpha [Strongyloides ratti]|uniref:Lissencephaly-1 homolog n=1 Tax=Strongyloides ratti TaxID=34506 RepID=A0A090LHJ4_STRRB|nr:Platelet-activating factor acetylhydrolase IB subunit alpha [Strongyloides ratti]CEF66985.1 Platelet-activating factor acetylhydrolase IB subunit alpha [Strongyloides ratti]
MVMNLSDKQLADLNIAIADYLRQKGFEETFKIFQTEANVDNQTLNSKNDTDALERRWRAVARLQKKVTDLEKKLQEYETGGLTNTSLPGATTRGSKKADEWLPRPPERLELTGHRGPVTRVIFHPIYSVIASCSEDASIRIWDFETGDYERSLKGHTNVINDICFDAKGKMLVSCSSDVSIKVWDFTGNYECLKTLKGHDADILTVACLTNSDHILSGSRDRTIKMWELASGYCIFNFCGHEDWIRMIRVSPDGLSFASASNDKTVRVWNIQTRQVRSILSEHEHIVEAVAWAPPQSVQYIVPGENKENTESNSYILITGSRDKTIRIFNTVQGFCMYTLTGHDNWVRDLIVHPGGKYLISVGDDRTMRIWCFDQKRNIKTINAHNGFVSCIAMHHLQPYIATASNDSSVKIWECR